MRRFGPQRDSSWLLRRVRNLTTAMFRVLIQTYSLSGTEQLYGAMSACRVALQEAVRRHMMRMTFEAQEAFCKLLKAMKDIEGGLLGGMSKDITQVNMLTLFDWCVEPFLRRLRSGLYQLRLTELPDWVVVKEHVILVGELLSLQNHADPYFLRQHLSQHDMAVVADPMKRRRLPPMSGEAQQRCRMMPSE